MIKRFLIVFILIICCMFSIHAGSLAIGTDFASLQDLIPQWSDRTGQVTVDFSSPITDTFGLTVPLSFTFNERSCMLETGLSLVYYPWAKGPFASMSLIQFGFIAGTNALEKKTYGLNEAAFGWTFTVRNRLVIEPSVVIRDPSSVFKDDYLALKGEYPCYRTIRGRLLIRWKFWSD